MTWILGIIKIIVLLGTLITIHELGHFLVARLFKVRVLKFAIGFGPKIFTKESNGTEYTLRLIPFGGFVQMEGEEERSDDEAAFNKKPIWQRILIVAAGAIVNIIFAILIYFAIVSCQGVYQSSIVTNLKPTDYAYEAGLRNEDEILKVNGKRTLTGWKVSEIIEASKDDKMSFEIKRDGEVKNLTIDIPITKRGLVGASFYESGEIALVYEGTPANDAKLMIGDVVTTINGVIMNGVDDIVGTIRSLPNQSIEIGLIRSGEAQTINVETTSDSSRLFDVEFKMIEPGFWKGLKYAILETNWYLNANFEAYGKLFIGRAENVEVMGVVGIANEITKTSAWREFFQMMCAISLSLGIFNLLPIPALDGGRILILIIEAIRRKPMKENVEQTIILIGFAVIIIFALVVTIFDVGKLFH